jgi:hypothetical protein
MPTQNIFSSAAYNTISDPGTGAAIPVTQSANLTLTIGSAGAETNTLANPIFAGQIIAISAGTVGTGTRVVTVANSFNAAGNTIATFDAAGDSIIFIGTLVGSNLRWRVLTNNAVALS